MRVFRRHAYDYTSKSLPAGFGVQTYLRPAIVTAAVSCLLLFSLLRAAAVYETATQQTYTPAAVKTTAKVAAAAAAAPTPALTPTPTPTVKATVASTPSAPNCTPDVGYAGPGALSLAGSAGGLTTVIDATHYYQIYGYTNTQIRQQINACAPKLSAADFTGYTTYKLSWQYSYNGNADGTCTLANPKLGIHIGEVLPSWQASAYATSGLASKWANFAANLDTHERGHVSLDQQYAAQIMANLQAMPATDCGSITAQANAIINNGVAALDAANANYDNQTNHGATQGAILP